MENGEVRDLPLGAAGDTILDNLGFDDGADSLEKRAQVAGLCALGDLLDKDGALVAVILGDLGLGRRLLAATVAALFTTVAAAVAGPITVLVIATVATRGAGARTPTSAVVVAAASALPATTTAAVSVARAAATGPITVFICVSTFVRTGAASISPSMVSVAAATPVAIGLTMTVPTVPAPITAITTVGMSDSCASLLALRSRSCISISRAVSSRRASTAADVDIVFGGS
jgi:hypothetical protein